MEWREYLNVLLRRKRIIITAVLICAGAAAFISYWQQVTYEAVSSITVSNNDVVALQEDIGRASSLDALRDAVARATSSELAAKVKEETGTNIPTSQLMRMVRVEAGVDVLGSAISTNSDTQIPIIQLVVTDTDRNRATKLANAYTNAVIEDSRISAEERIKKALDLVNKELSKYQTELSNASAQIGALNQGTPIIQPDGTISLSTTGSANVKAYAEWGRIVGEYNILSGKRNLLRLMQINALNPPLKISERVQKANRVQTTMPVSILLGLLAGITLGIGGASILEYIGERPKTSKEIEDLFQVPSLGFVSTSPHNYNEYLEDDGKSLLAEDYRLLRTRIKTSTSKRQMRSFLIVSPLNEFCAPIVLSNLAIAFAQSGATVLIIASNLRDSMVIPFFNSDHAEARGLSYWLTHMNSINSLIKKTGIERLHILPSGVRDDSVIKKLDTTQIENLLEQIGITYDYILLEGPPINKSADSAILAAAVDGIVLVATDKEITPVIAGNAIQRLESAKGRIIGVVDAAQKRIE